MDLKSEFEVVARSRGCTRQQVIEKWMSAPEEFRDAAMFLFRDAKENAGISFKARNDGISGYGRDIKDKERECLHIKICNRPPKLTIYQHAGIEDAFFNKHQGVHTRIKHGDWIPSQDVEQNHAELKHIAEILRQSYATITGIKKLISHQVFDTETIEDLKEQTEILKQLELQKTSREKIIKELEKANEKSLTQETDLKKFTNNKKIRDNRAIALIKSVRGFKCQICNAGILMRNGELYIEAAHIISKEDNGRECLGNILVLCPNHHKEFDLGNKMILSHEHNEVVFSLNGKEYSISLSLS
ncbi:MAG: hypothetical protein HGB26_03770 [Desulfobulbaceae bacterium]|nr:hypothetical protein [Desulfobulbaceae bacterium]